MNRGIDKLVLTLPHGAFQIANLSEGAGWGFNRNTTPAYPTLPVLLQDGRGKVITARGAHLNAGQLQHDINDKGLRIILNPSKLITEHPFHLAGVEALQEVESIIERTYLPYGVDYDWSRAKFTRIDLACQAEMDEPLPLYAEILRLMKGTRMSTLAYPGGTYFRNGQKEGIFYGKRDQLLHDYKSDMGCSSRLQRGEFKVKTSEEVEKRFSSNMWQDLKSMTNQNLHEIYRGFMQKVIFKTGQGFQTYIPYEDLRQRFEKHLSPSGKISSHTLNKYKSEHGMEAVLARHGGVECYLQFLREMGMSRQKVHDERRRILESVDLNIKGMEKKNSNLLEELKLKFAA